MLLFSSPQPSRLALKKQFLSQGDYGLARLIRTRPHRTGIGSNLTDCGVPHHQTQTLVLSLHHEWSIEGKRVEVTVEKLKHPHTNSQNRYYHGVVVKTIAQHTGVVR